MYEKPDGCPKCGSRGNAPTTWDDDSGCGTYTCHSCADTWTTHWEIPKPDLSQRVRIIDLPYKPGSTCCMCDTPTDDRTCSPSCAKDLAAAHGYPTDEGDQQ